MSELKSIISSLSTKYINKLVVEKKIRYNPKLHATSLTKLLIKIFDTNYLGTKDTFSSKIDSDNVYEYITYIIKELKKDLEIIPFEIDFNEMNLIMNITMANLTMANLTMVNITMANLTMAHNTSKEPILEKNVSNTFAFSQGSKSGIGLSTSVPIKINHKLNGCDDGDGYSDEDDFEDSDSLMDKSSGIIFANQNNFLLFDDNSSDSDDSDDIVTNRNFVFALEQ